MELQTPPAAKEYYHYGFKELGQKEGEARALELVDHYRQLSKQFSNCTTWFIHNCKLLSTFANPEIDTDTYLSLLDRQCSVFYYPITNLTNQKVLTLNQVVQLIKRPVFSTITQNLRGISDKKLNSLYKRNAFCYATFSGTFQQRYDNQLVQHSGLICIDIDGIGECLNEVRARVNADPATVISFISPNGDGLKVLFEMDPQTHTQEQYYRAYSTYLTKLCGLSPGKIDSSCKNVSRACFLPHDPEIFINPYFSAE